MKNGKTASSTPINLDQARAELVRAEELLKQRHANTRLVLQKQKELTAELASAKALVGTLQKRLKEETRQKEKHKLESMRKDVIIGELRSQVKQAGQSELQSWQAITQSDVRPQTPSDEDLRSALSDRGRGRERICVSVDSRNVSRNVSRHAKRKARDVAGVGDTTKDMLTDMLAFVVDVDGQEGDKLRKSLHERVDTAVDDYLGEIPAGRAGWAVELAGAAFDVLMGTCVLQQAVCQWADLAWSPRLWFCSAGSKSTQTESIQQSLIATWCDPIILQQDFIPWLLACLRRLEEKSGQQVLKLLLDKCVDEVLSSCSERNTSTVPRVCVAATVVAVLCKMLGRHGLDMGMKVAVDIQGRDMACANNGLVALAVMMEVCPELYVIIGPRIHAEAAPRLDGVYEMASMTLHRLRANEMPAT